MNENEKQLDKNPNRFFLPATIATILTTLLLKCDGINRNSFNDEPHSSKSRTEQILNCETNNKITISDAIDPKATIIFSDSRGKKSTECKPATEKVQAETMYNKIYHCENNGYRIVAGEINPENTLTVKNPTGKEEKCVLLRPMKAPYNTFFPFGSY